MKLPRLAWFCALTATASALFAQAPVRLRSVGSDAMEGVMKRWAALNAAAHPGTELAVVNAPTSKGLEALAKGTAQFSPSGRLAWPEEIKVFSDLTGYPPFRVTVARCTISSKELPHPHAVFVSADNPLGRLTLTEIDAIFSTTRRRGGPHDITTWGQLGLTGDWAQQPIHLYGVSWAKGPSHFFAESALQDGTFKASVVTVNGEEDVLAKLAQDKYGIAYTGLPFTAAGTKRLAIAEKAGAPYYSGTPEEIRADRYPLSRVIYLTVNRAPGQRLAPAVKTLLEIALSSAGQKAAAVDGYLPLSTTQRAEQLARLQ
jgi:phosphate transport system substrate-binding protein